MSTTRQRLLEFICKSQHFNLPALTKEDLAQLARLYHSAMEQSVEPDLEKVVHRLQTMRAVLYPTQKAFSDEMIAYIIADNF